jgi:methionine-rich copper-binding protein CopC
MLKNVLLGVSLCGLLAAGQSLAHARLQSSTPADNAQLTHAPTTLSLNFSEAARLARLRLTLDGKEIPVALDKNAKPSQSFTLTLPALAPGSYTVEWAAVAADDGHVTKGAFKFSIAG